MHETPSLLLLLIVLLAAHPAEPLSCQSDYEIPAEIEEMIQEEKEKGGLIEIREETPVGYITSFFYGQLFLEGLFYIEEGAIVYCDISNAVRVEKDESEDGERDEKPTFIWFKNQQEM